MIINTNRLIFISDAKFYRAWAWQEGSDSDVDYLMASLLLQGLHVTEGAVVCPLTEAKLLTTVDMTSSSPWASLGPGQTLFKPKDEVASISLDCFSLTGGRGGRQAVFQPAQLKSKVPGLIY